MFINPVLSKTYTTTPTFAVKSFATRPLKHTSFDSVNFGASLKKVSEEPDKVKQPFKSRTSTRVIVLLMLMTLLGLGGRELKLELDQLREATKEFDRLMQEMIEKTEENRALERLIEERFTAGPMSDDVSSLNDAYPNIYYDKTDKKIEEWLPLIEQEFDLIFAKQPNLKNAFNNIERFCVTTDGDNSEEWEKFGLPLDLREKLSKSNIYGSASGDGKYVGVTFVDIMSLLDQVHEFSHTLLSDEDAEKYKELLNSDLEKSLSKLKHLDPASLPQGFAGNLEYALIGYDFGGIKGYSPEGNQDPAKENFATLASYLLLDKCGISRFGTINDDDTLRLGVEIAEATKILREYFPESCKFIDNLLNNSGIQKSVDEP